MHTEPQLTAYALDDTSLTPAERSAIESRLAHDPALRAEVDAIRQFGGLLASQLAVEAPVTVPKPVATRPTKQPRKWLFQPWELGVLTTLVLLVGAVIGIQQPQGSSTSRSVRAIRPEVMEGVPPRDDLIVEYKSYEERDSGSTIRMAAVNPHPWPTYAPQPFEPVQLPTSRGDVDLYSFTGRGVDSPPGTITKNGTGTYTLPQTRYYTETVTVTSSTGIPQTVNRTVTVTKGAPQLSSMPYLNQIKERTQDLASSKIGDPKDANDIQKQPNYEQSGNSYRQLIENKFITVKGEDALSTFGVDVDTASYSLIRNYLNRNTLPPPDAVRLEEMINYFPYTDIGPEGKDPYAVNVEVAECPWQTKHRLARIAVKARAIDKTKRPPSNLVFLIDVSGSMNVENRLPLVKESMKLLVNQLGENDKVAIVVYAGASGLVLNSTNCHNKKAILDALDKLESGGSTNGAAGIELAYQIAANNYIDKGTNRVILCTDGDWNVGTTSTTALTTLIEEKRKTNVFLSVFGFGMGNLRDEMLVQLSNKGNGNYGYIDTINEAKKLFVEQLSSTLVTVAKDVKIQIEFNPAQIAAYRLIGYEKRILTAKDFKNDKIDAGEMGAGHTVTALYELVPVEKAPEVKKDDKTNELRYQTTIAPKPVEGNVGKESFVIKLRHKETEKETATQRDLPYTDAMKKDKPSEDFQFCASVAAFGLMLKQSEYRGNASFELIEELVKGSMKHDPGEYRLEFLGLVTKAKGLMKK